MRRLIRFAIPLTLGLALAACGTSTPTPSQPDVSGASVTAPPSAPIAAQPLATLTFEPATLSLKVGEVKEVKAVLDLKSYASQTYQAEITFNSDIIEIESANATKKEAVALGMYENPILNTVEAGRIKIAGYSITKGKEALGTGTLVTIKVKGKAAGTSSLAFDRDGSNVAKTKVILMGTSTDILLSTGTASVTVE